MADELEGMEVKFEEAEATPAEEEPKATEAKAESTVDITKTEEFRRAVDKAVGKSVESLNRQLSQHQAEVKAAKAEAELLKAQQAQLDEDRKSLEAEVDRLASERFNDDPEAYKGYKSTRQIQLKEKQIALKEAEIGRKEAELEGLRWAITMHRVADRLQKQYQVPREVLEACSSEEQMEKIAKAFPEVSDEEPKAPEKKAPKFDSGVSSGGGIPAKPTVEQLEAMSEEQFAKWAASRYK